MQRTTGSLGSSLFMKFHPQLAATRHPASRRWSDSRQVIPRMIQRCLLVAALLLFTACRESQRDIQARRDHEREQRLDATLEHFTAQHPGIIRLETREPGSIFRKLTIDAQEAIGAGREQLYWNISDQFDIYRDSSGPRLVFRAISDHWVWLACTDAQVADIRKQRRADRTFVSFALAFTLSSASPLHVELRGSSSGTGDDVSLAVAADEITGRLYTGRLVDFVLLGEGQSIETP
jgi:hypothetical protein